METILFVGGSLDGKQLEVVPHCHTHVSANKEVYHRHCFPEFQGYGKPNCWYMLCEPLTRADAMKLFLAKYH